MFRINEENQKFENWALLIPLMFVFLLNFLILRNNVYCADDLLCHFFTNGITFKKIFLYGSWIMQLQNFTMYIIPFKLGIHFQSWALLGALIKAFTLTLVFLFFIKTLILNKINTFFAVLFSLFSYISLFLMYKLTDYTDLVIFSGFFRFIVPSCLLVISFYYLYKSFSGEKVNLFWLICLCFITSSSSELASGILSPAILMLIVLELFNKENFKSVLPHIYSFISSVSGTLVLISTLGFRTHFSDKLGTQVINLQEILSNFPDFSIVFFKVIILKYLIIWLLILGLIIYNFKKNEITNIIFPISVLFGLLTLCFSFIIMGKTSYDEGFWIEHYDIHSVIILTFIYALICFASPLLRNNFSKFGFKFIFSLFFIVQAGFFTVFALELYSKLTLMKDYTYLRDKVRMFYFYKNQPPILPLSAHYLNVFWDLAPVQNNIIQYEQFHDRDIEQKNFKKLDDFYYTITYGEKVSTPETLFLTHKEGLDVFTKNGGSYSEIVNRKYHFGNLKNKNFVLNIQDNQE